MLVWHAVHADQAGSCLLGVSTEVARIIGSFSLTELDQAVERRFQYVRPRWEERPAVWRALLLSAQRGDPRRTREVNVWTLQLLTGDLLSGLPAVH
jgi:predicted NAD/FAD-binding protein